MKPDAALELLHHVAELLKVRVSYEAVGSAVGNGGLCKVKGEYRIIIDKRASSEERVIMIATALASFDTAALDLTPKTRQLLRQYENSSKSKRTAA